MKTKCEKFEVITPSSFKKEKRKAFAGLYMRIFKYKITFSRDLTESMGINENTSLILIKEKDRLILSTDPDKTGFKINYAQGERNRLYMVNHRALSNWVNGELKLEQNNGSSKVEVIRENNLFMCKLPAV